MLWGLEIGGFRSFGTVLRLSRFGKVNLFVGTNNSGKSNVLRFIQRFGCNVGELLNGNSNIDLAPDERHLGAEPFRLGTVLNLDPAKEAEELYDQIKRRIGVNVLTKFVEAIAPQGECWITRGAQADIPWPSKELCRTIQPVMTDNEWRVLWSSVLGRSGGDILEHWIPETLRHFRQRLSKQYPVAEIPVDRRVLKEIPPVQGQRSDSQTRKVIRLDGAGSIQRLAEMQNPNYTDHAEQSKKFKAVTAFVAQILDAADTTIYVPHTQDQVYVSTRGRSHLPLASLGSGIEQVVLHAVAATSISKSLVCFEEPELHLHPVLQRQLIDYLQRDTDNQYFIATHSAHMIDLPGVDVFHVELENGESRVAKVSTHSDQWRVCQILGYRASDIVQANCVLWIEGPSDRIYLKHWLTHVAPELVEGHHYSLMFYGGKLLSHLSADIEPEEFIDLRRLNRHVAVIIDSDKKSARDPIRETKLRVQSEITQHGGFVWITQGREIENYVEPATLRNAVFQFRPDRASKVATHPFHVAVPKTSEKKNAPSLDKIKIATLVAKEPASLDRLDLRARIEALAGFILQANGIRGKAPTQTIAERNTDSVAKNP